MTALPPRDVVVCVVGAGDGELRARTLDSVRAHTPGDVPVLEVDSDGDAFTAAAPADVALLKAGCVVAAGWLEGLREAAYASSATATAAAVTPHDLRLDAAESEPAAAAEFERAAAAVRSGSLALRPRTLRRPTGPSVYVRRSALELAGEDQDFWRRCLELGLAHVLADDVLVLDPGPDRHQTDDPTAPLGRALSAARRAVHGLSVTVDARVLHGATTGTHVHVLELIAALSRTGKVRLTAIIPDQPSQHAIARLRTLPALSLVTYRDASERADLVHRPFQLSNAGDLCFLQTLGDRLILTQQDLIGYHNPAYFPTGYAWDEYRRLTRLALTQADRVVFSSAHARDDALSEELVVPARADVVHLGVDHPLVPPQRPPAPPTGAERFAADGRPAILCLGTDYHHKNRVFALHVLERLRNPHGWDGLLVFAGPSVAFGSSREREARFVSAHPELAAAIVDVGVVSEPEKDWLLGRSALIIYPTVFEGFGLVPFEAAAHGAPCLWAPGSSLSELLPDAAAGIVPWDAGQSAAHALALMRDGDARAQNLRAIGEAATGLTWDATAARLLDVYRATADSPAQTRTGTSVSLDEDAARLVGPGGELPADVRRPLLALATHPRIAGPVFAALKIGYRASYRVGRLHRRK